MNYIKEREIAVQAVVEAAALCQQVRSQRVDEAIAKEDKSPVTIADFGAQALICRALATAFPQDPVVGEEDSNALTDPAQAAKLAQATEFVQAAVPTATTADVIDWIDHGNGAVAQRYWTLDPIDGTKGFLRGDQYAVALALVEDGDVKVAVLACPALTLDLGSDQSLGENSSSGVLLVALRGQGATCRNLGGGPERKLSVTRPEDSAHFRFVESVEHGDKALQQKIAQGMAMTQPAIQMDSQAKYAAVAAGQAALYLRLPSPKTPDYREKIWDHAAGALIVEEAGGRVTDMHGQPLDFSRSARLTDNQGVIVSNGTIHDTVLALLNE